MALSRTSPTGKGGSLTSRLWLLVSLFVAWASATGCAASGENEGSAASDGASADWDASNSAGDGGATSDASPHDAAQGGDGTSEADGSSQGDASGLDSAVAHDASAPDSAADGLGALDAAADDDASGGCPTGETPCPPFGCKDLTSDFGNCHVCANACPVGTACINSACASPAALPTNLQAFAAVLGPDGQVYVLGGLAADNGGGVDPLATVYVYSPATKPGPPRPR